ncbi:RNA-binding S4 domain-containing protein [Kiloniella laminariae]|uniref:RNA-binding S4 domain-containing protein n=1 Tax=Kiloniella laminariae TaxID=454162 RepID=A0ABT4LK30_9PROT|nr:RNA-binding S4 domain-containing protein [Kiloniella laminariae]MCZ4281456.1 RNA-binding S4 domain-containing protein [Kiloniella laminariae]
MPETGQKTGAETLRIDKWLWYARFFKSRSLASEACNSGRIRAGGAAVRKSSHAVRIGEVLTFSQGPHIRVIKILALGQRRGPAPEAQLLYEDLEPPQKKTTNTFPAEGGVREAGSGRPTKKDRRETDRLRGE